MISHLYCGPGETQKIKKMQKLQINNLHCQRTSYKLMSTKSFVVVAIYMYACMCV